MGLPQKGVAWISPDAYLRLEEAALTKSEYLDGVIYDWQGYGPKAMAGGSVTHNQVSLNAATSLRAQLKGGPCRVLMADVRLNLADRSAYFYPDVMVTCSAADRARDDGASEPSLIVEVLSDSTEAFDRGDKFSAYRRIEALQTYVIVSPRERSVEVYRRSDGWAAGEPLGLHDIVTLPEPALQITVADLFADL